MNPAFNNFDPMAARRPATAGGSGLAQQIAQGTGGGQLPQSPGTGSPPVAQQSAMARPAPTAGSYFAGGNIGQSATGAKSPTGNPAQYPADFNANEYPWMADQSIQWGGGPFGYLPIGYQPKSYDYYSQHMTQLARPRQGAQNRAGIPLQDPGAYAPLAPWEQRYFQDTWTQNYDPNQPGYIDTGHPENWPNVRG
jgi:hypothetical protein